MKKDSMEPTLPVLPRIDRLDRLLELLEEKHSKTKGLRSTTTNDDDDDDGDEQPKCKSLLSALDDVHHKGTLIDRLAMLENRVLQLILDMEEGSTSRSSSSTAYTTKEETEFPIENRATQSIGKVKRRMVHFKWMRWFSMRC